MNDIMLQKYIPFKKKEFRPHQEEAINQIINSIEDGNRFTILNAPVGVGKALALDTIVPTDEGFKTIKEIKIGDIVFNECGKPVKVLNKTEIWKQRPCYKITFKNGFSVIADEKHEWVCNYNIDSKSSKEFKVRETKQMWENYQRNEKYRYYIKKNDPVLFSTKELPIPPYTLGIWLGDGTQTSSDITINDLDTIIWDEIEKEGFHISEKYRKKGKAHTAAILNFHSLLRENNLLKNKHIPDVYFYASYEDRLSLIQGLIDSDGSIDKKGNIEFSNNNIFIIDGLRVLLNSIGITANITTRIPKLNGKSCNRNYRLNFKPTITDNVTRLPRYKKRIIIEKRKWGTTHVIDSIEKTENQDTICIQVEGGIFCIGDCFIPTHNSLIGYVTAKYLETLNLKTYLCTGTKILQSQYINDFQDVKTIKGRMNFNCATEPLFDCSKGMCQSSANYRCASKPILKDYWEFNNQELPENPIEDEDGEFIFYGDEEFDEWFLDGMCPYWEQKIKGIMSPITMLNYDYLISDRRFVQHLPYRKLLVCDEGHNIEKILMRQLETSFSPSVVKKETGFEIQTCNTINDWVIQFGEVSDLYKELAKTTTSDTKKKRMQEKHSKFSVLQSLLEKHPENWVYVPEKKNNHLFLVFKPITVSDYTNLIFNVAQHVVIMTGTVLKQDIFARELGIDDFSYIEIPSIIPAKQRPIIKSYVGAMSRSSIDQTMPNMIAKIKEIAEKHYDEKGVLHTYTYEVSRRIREAFTNDDRYIFHNSKNKEEKFNDFKADKTNKILVSPVAFEGIDFPYDQARWQCICKEPFPNMRDPQISVRDSIDYDWVFRQRCLVLSQIYGRTNRGPEDWSITYLLDSRLDTLLGPSSLVTDYFLEALDGLRYDDKLILNANAYDKLTKDNSRKTHEFDREVERNVLDDISNGFDTLSSLRKEYKKFPSDAYKYITPAVERLLKHGAIRYD